ncbi:hypothetical protein JRQ81_017841, partial [Phrynocephalus forsythii]
MFVTHEQLEDAGLFFVTHHPEVTLEQSKQRLLYPVKQKRFIYTVKKRNIVFFRSKRVVVVGKSVSSTHSRKDILKWVAIHQTLKKRVEAKEKRSTVGGRLQAVLLIAELTAVRNQEGSQGHGLEITNLVHIHMKRGAGKDLAAARHMDPRENRVAADLEGMENHIDLRDQDQRAEQE